MTTGEHFSKRNRFTVPGPEPLTPDLSQNHPWSLSQLPHGGWASSPCRRGVRQTNSTPEARKPPCASPKGTTEEPESMELGGQAIEKPSWQEFKGQQEANLDPALLTWVWKEQRKNKKIM